MINERQAKQYCYEDISLIENYAEAAADETRTWDLHHRNETVMNCGARELIAAGAYYDRPARELVFLTHAEHTRLHKKGRLVSEKTRREMSEAKKGRPNGWTGKRHSEETRLKLSEAHRGKTPWLGKHHSDETKRKLSEAKKGKVLSEETRRRMSEAKKAYWKNRRDGLAV